MSGILPDTIDVTNVELIPELAVNLLSVGKIVVQGHSVTFIKTGCKVINPTGKIIATGQQSNGLFKLEQKPSKALACRKRQICGTSASGIAKSGKVAKRHC